MLAGACARPFGRSGRLSSLVSSRAVGADISSAGPASAHQARVARPNHAGVLVKHRASAASPSRIAASAASVADGSGVAVMLVLSQPTSAQTRRPWLSPRAPECTDSPRTTSRPRPCSASGSSMNCGPSGAPPSVTATRTICPYQVTLTVNWPPRPLRVCCIALLASSSATVITSSRSGRGGSSDASQ